MTADASGIIVDTSAGMISSTSKDKNNDQQLNEKYYRNIHSLRIHWENAKNLIYRSNQLSESDKLEQIKTIQMYKNHSFTQYRQNMEKQGAREIKESAIIQDDSESESDISEREPQSPVKSDESVESDDEGLFGDIQEEKKVTQPLIIEQTNEAQDQDEEILSEESDEEEEEDEEEDEEEMEDAVEPAQPLLKPVFVRREERDTIIEKEKKDLEEKQKLEKQKQKQEERIKETKELVQKTIEDENKSVESDDDNKMPDDTDKPEDELEEYEKWKQREFVRIKRDLEEREQNENEKKEVERRRLLTDEERELENK